ncbi:MAG: KamA family radical SAM protein [Bryobacterales bacterium]
MNKPKYVTKLDHVVGLSEAERQELAPVSEKFVFRANDYYLNLIDWDDPEDPIRRLVIPDASELSDWGRLDASHEELYTKAPGLEHKYRDTALLLCNDVCGAYCRYCFRKRLFMDDNDEVVKDVQPGLNYIRQHPEINNVLLTGGDPLIMSTSKLEPIVAQLREIPHVKIIRIGSKMPAFNPHRILHDEALHAMLRKYSTPEQGRIYVMCHFNHPRELTDEARASLDVLQRNGATTINQTPLIRGINDDVETLRELFGDLSYLGVPPYYVFHCRPTEGNEAYSMPVEEGFRIFLAAQQRTSGLARRARYSMSHVTGKIEVVALTPENVILRYHRAASAQNEGRTLVFKRNPEAQWFDDYAEAVAYLPELPAASRLVSIESDLASRA